MIVTYMAQPAEQMDWMGAWMHGWQPGMGWRVWLFRLRLERLPSSGPEE